MNALKLDLNKWYPAEAPQKEKIEEGVDQDGQTLKYDIPYVRIDKIDFEKKEFKVTMLLFKKTLPLPQEREYIEELETTTFSLPKITKLKKSYRLRGEYFERAVEFPLFLFPASQNKIDNTTASGLSDMIEEYAELPSSATRVQEATYAVCKEAIPSFWSK